ncbi:MAG: hypothetical protein P4M09_21225 [Devosia sp.]|nr:hypothetical protein [Devosia sp.]
MTNNAEQQQNEQAGRRRGWTGPHSYAKILRAIAKFSPDHPDASSHLKEIIANAIVLDDAEKLELILGKLAKKSGVSMTKLRETVKRLRAAGAARPVDDDGDNGGDGAETNPFGAAACPRQSDHSALAALTLARIGQPICFHFGKLWTYQDSLWSRYGGEDETSANQWIEAHIHDAAAAANAASNRTVYDDTNELRAETRRFIRTMPSLQYNSDWDSHGLIPLANGLFDPKARTLAPYTPEARATWRMAVGYDSSVGFERGKQALADLFASYADQAAYVKFIQQVLYVALFMHGRRIGRALRRALYLVGPKWSGKSVLVDLLQYAVGEGNHASTALDALTDRSEARFALGSVITRRFWLVNEATQEATVLPAAPIKSVFAEDMMSSDVKNARNRIEARFLGMGVFSSNTGPRTRDSADGFADRFNIVLCRETFDEERPRGVALMAKEAGYADMARYLLDVEGPGLLNWALEARYMEDRTNYDVPDAVVAARQVIADAANPLRVFARDCLEEAPLDTLMATGDVYAVYLKRFEEDNGPRHKHGPMSPHSFWAKLNDFYAKKRGSVPRDVAKVRHGTTVCAGLKLTAEGLEIWRRARAPSSTFNPPPHGSAPTEAEILMKAPIDQLMKINKFFGAG